MGPVVEVDARSPGGSQGCNARSSSSPSAVDAAAAVATGDGNGWFGFLTVPIEGLLKIIHQSLSSAGVSEAWGLSIIAMTVLIKALTFPLTKTQLESTNKMQVSENSAADYFMKLLARFFVYADLKTDWNSLKDADEELLVNSLSILCPFESEDKQALLEAPCLSARRETLITLLEFSLLGGNSGRSLQ